jgi:small subunit ribosomal protein S6
MAFYEVIFIARQDLSADDVDNLSDKLSQIIIEHEGKILSKEYWGLRILAYKISKNARGHYVLLNIDSNHEGIKELQRVVGFNENIIRSNIFSVSENQGPSKLMICKNAKDSKTDKASEEILPSAIDLEIDKIAINNL